MKKLLCALLLATLLPVAPAGASAPERRAYFCVASVAVDQVRAALAAGRVPDGCTEQSLAPGGLGDPLICPILMTMHGYWIIIGPDRFFIIYIGPDGDVYLLYPTVGLIYDCPPYDWAA